ncbi:MAG: transcriptional repressor LexA [Moorellales bacterium]
MNLGERIRRLREERGLSQAELARRSGLSPQYLCDIELNKANPGVRTLEKIATGLGVPPSRLLEDPVSLARAEAVVEVPVIGRVPAGGPVVSEETVIGYLPLPRRFAEEGFICLEVSGDSMEGVGIYDGDCVLVRLQPTAENGQTVVARVDGEVTVKRFYRVGNKVRLEPANAGYRPIEPQQVEIIGVVKKVIRDVY